MISKDVRQLAEHSVLCWLATIADDGWPNVAPKEIFCIADNGHILIADIASPQSARNIQRNAKVCVSFIDVFVQKGYKIKGEARVIARGDAGFSALAAPLQSQVGEAFTLQAVLEIRPTAIEPIIAPRYRFYPGTSEAEQISQAMQRYGVRPLA